MFNKNFYLAIFFIYQLFSVTLIAIGIWPKEVAYINLAAQLAALLFFDLEYALYSAIISIPFYLAIPNTFSDSLSTWRLVFLALFALVIYKCKEIKLASWDSALKWLLAISAISLLFARYPGAGLKQLLFVVNIYFIYFATLAIIENKEQIWRLIKVIFASSASIVLIGFIQFAATFLTTPYYFWQYWAQVITPSFYGQSLANTLVYSNSWFTFVSNQPISLRMFSVLPDSHAFGVIAILSLPACGALLLYVQKKWQRGLLYAYMFFSILGIIFSGTRGIWAAILVPLMLLLYLYAKRMGRDLLKRMFIPIILFFIFLAFSPVLQKLNFRSDSTLQRVSSIYDLSESSNAGRLEIWGKTLMYSLRNPFFGTGFGNFLSIVTEDPNYQDAANQRDINFNIPKKYITAHNIYLQMLAETGVFGLAAFLVYLKNILVSFWNFFKKKYLFSDDGLVFFTASCAIYMIWIFAYMLFDTTLFNDRVLMYFLLNLAASWLVIKNYA